MRFVPPPITTKARPLARAMFIAADESLHLARLGENIRRAANSKSGIPGKGDASGNL